MAVKDLITSINSEERFVNAKLNFPMAYKANKNYVAYSVESDYETNWKQIYPYAPKFTGTVATNVFTGTGIPIDLANKFAVFFKQADVTPIITGGDLSQLANINYDVRKITASTATSITVSGNIKTGMTDCIVMDKAWWTIANLKDFTLTDTANPIEDNHRDSGGYTNSILGIKDANITGVSGSYFVTLHTHFALNIAKDSETPVYLCAGASLNIDESIIAGNYLLNEFNKTGQTDGNGVTQYSGNFLLRGTPTKKYVTTEGTIPDFF